MEIGIDVPDIPLGMLTDFHLKRCKLFSLSSLFII